MKAVALITEDDKACKCEFRKASEFGKVVCEFGNGFANLAMGLRIWQWVANLAKWFAKLAMWFAKLAMWFAKLAMRNFAKVLKFLCEKRSSQMNSACG